MNVTVTVTSTVTANYDAPTNLLVGAAVALVSVLLTYVMSTRQSRKERLLEEIYRPLLGQVARTFVGLKIGEMPNMDELDRLKKDGLYYLMDEKVKETVDLFRAEIHSHKDECEIAKGKITGIIKETIGLIGSKYGLRTPSNCQLIFKAYVEGQPVEFVELEDCLLTHESPRQLLIQKRPLLNSRKFEIKTLLSGFDISQQIGDEIWRSAAETANEDKDIQAVWELRKRLQNDTPILWRLLKKVV